MAIARLYRGGPPRNVKWKGYGQQRQTLVNAKIVVQGGRAEVSAYGSYSDRAEVDYQDLSLEMLGRLGYNWDNISNNYALAVKVADVAPTMAIRARWPPTPRRARPGLRPSPTLTTPIIRAAACKDFLAGSAPKPSSAKSSAARSRPITR
jgi:hypothetical protein